MEYNKPVAEMRPGDEVEGFYILKGAFPKTTAAGKPFLSAVLMDRSGQIEAKVWDYSGPIGQADEGRALKIRGKVTEYRGMLQLIVEKLRLRQEDDAVPLERLVPTAPLDADETYRAVEQLASSIEDGDYRAVCLEMLRRRGTDLRDIPAAKSVHHSFLHGLLMHTYHMLRLADFLAGLYADTVDRSLLLAGTLLHDFAKAREFTFSDLGLVNGYSVPGQLLGHLVMGAQEAADVCRELKVPEEKAVLLEHLLLSHHGEPEFGAAVRPMCAESELLCLIDNVDSRMEIYRETMAGLAPGEMSGRVFALDKRIYRHR